MAAAARLALLGASFGDDEFGVGRGFLPRDDGIGPDMLHAVDDDALARLLARDQPSPWPALALEQEASE